MSSANDLHGQNYGSDDGNASMKNLFEIIGMNEPSAVSWSPTAPGTISLPLSVQTKDGQITYIITTVAPAQSETPMEKIESSMQSCGDINPAPVVDQDTEIIIHQSPMKETHCELTQTKNSGDEDVTAVIANLNYCSTEVPQDQVGLELWNPVRSDGLATIHLDPISSSSIPTVSSTSIQCLKQIVIDDATNSAFFTITEPSSISNNVSLPHPGSEPLFQHTYATNAKSDSNSDTVANNCNSNTKDKSSRFKSKMVKTNSTKAPDIHCTQSIRHGRKGIKMKSTKKLQTNLSSNSSKSQSVQMPRPRCAANRKKSFQESQTTTAATSTTISPKKKRTIADWLAVGIDPTKLEENVDQVRNRFEEGCDCPGEDENCFDGINPEFVYKHRLNIAELTRAEHDMYLMGALSSTLVNPEVTEKNSKRQRLRNAYVFLGREVCLDAWLYLENCTHYQLKRIRKHLITHGVSARVHGNQGKKPHNTFPFRSYQLAFEFLTNWFDNYVKKAHSKSAANSKDAETSSTGHSNSKNRHPKQNPAPIQLAPEQTRKRLHQEYKKYFEKQAKNAMGKAASENNTEQEDCEKNSASDEFKVMGYTSFSQFLKVRFPHVKFAKVELNNAKVISQATAAAALHQKNSNSSGSGNKTVASRTIHPIAESDSNNFVTIQDVNLCGGDVSFNVIDATNCEIEIVKAPDLSRCHDDVDADRDTIESSNLLASTNQTQFVFSIPISSSSNGDIDPKDDGNESTSIIYMMS